MVKKMELLAPAGDMDTAKAAFAAGADACYIGGKWSARAYAKNFGDGEIQEIIRYAHLRGKKIYVAVNTMLYEKEMSRALSYTRFLYENMADAVIAADLGYISEIGERFPGMEIHASTQSAVQGEGSARLLAELFCTRVVAARESTLTDLSAMAATGIEVEAFCHGAMCSGVSGVCLLSGMIGGRSGNRGRCAQPCRMEYELFGEKAYHLSTKDLCALGMINEFAKAGVCSLKIEGRMKNKHYVASAVDAYRRAIDAYYEGGFFDVKKERETLARIFNRGGFTKGYLMGGRDITYPSRPDHLGIMVGSIRRPVHGRAFLATKEPLHQGDSVEVGEEGYALAFADSAPGGYIIPVPEGAKEGEKVYLRGDTAVLARAEELCRDIFRIPVTLELFAEEGRAVRLTAQTEGAFSEVEGEIVPRALKLPDETQVKERLIKTGGTVFVVENCILHIQGWPFLSTAGLNALRRRVLADLEEQIMKAHGYLRAEVPPQEKARREKLEVHPYVAAQVRDMGRALAAWQGGAERVYLVSGGEEILAGARNVRKIGELWFVLPPYMSAGEEAIILASLSESRGVFDGILAPGPEGIALAKQAGLPFVSDYWQNIANTATARVLEDWGARGVSVSTEINLSAIAAVEGRAKEAVVYGRLPLMNLRHCPVKKMAGCEVCGKGVLKDRLSYEFPLLPLKVGGCLLQLYNAVPMAMTDMKALKAAGVTGIRLIFTDEEPETVRSVVTSYCRAWDKGEEAIFEQDVSRSFSKGHFFRGVE